MRRFDVFGRILGVERRGEQWAAFYLGADGTRREARDVVIPAAVPGEDLARYLSEIFHESATPRKPEVVELDP